MKVTLEDAVRRARGSHQQESCHIQTCVYKHAKEAIPQLAFVLTCVMDGMKNIITSHEGKKALRELRETVDEEIKKAYEVEI